MEDLKNDAFSRIEEWLAQHQEAAHRIALEACASLWLDRDGKVLGISDEFDSAADYVDSITTTMDHVGFTDLISQLREEDL